MQHAHYGNFSEGLKNRYIVASREMKPYAPCPGRPWLAQPYSCDINISSLRTGICKIPRDESVNEQQAKCLSRAARAWLSGMTLRMQFARKNDRETTFLGASLHQVPSTQSSSPRAFLHDLTPLFFSSQAFTTPSVN